MGGSVWADTIVGAEDNTTAYLGAKSEAYDLSKNGTWTFNFTNYNSGSGGNWDNWILECTNGIKDLFVLRADKFETVAWSSNNTVWGDETAWTDFVSKMNGATVAMTVTRNGQNISVSTTTTPSTGDSFTYSYNYYNASGDLSLYLSVSNSHITIQNASWEASGTVTTTLLSQDYESFTKDADIQTDMTSAGWSFRVANSSSIAVNALEETWNEDPAVKNKYLSVTYTSGRADRNQNWAFSSTALDALTEDNWTLSFKASMTPASNGSNKLSVYGTSTSNVTSNYDAVSNPFFMVTNGGGTSTTYTATIGESPVGDTFTISSGTWYRYIIKVTNIDTDNNTADISVTIKDMVGNDVFTNSQTNVSTAKIGTLNGIHWYAQKTTSSTLRLDDVLLTKNVDASICAAPTYISTGADGTSRKFTLSCETSNSTIYYSESDIAIGAAGWTEYTEEITTPAATLYAYANSGTANSTRISFSTGAGTTVKLATPTITRSSETTVTITADQSSLGFDVTPTASIYYTYGGDPVLYSGAISVSADATITAYAVLDNYVTSETASRAVALLPVNQVESATSDTRYTSTSRGEEQTVNGHTYSPLYVNESRWGKTLLLQSTGWGIRNGGDNWYTNTTSYILMPNMKQGDIISVHIDAKATVANNATYSEKYTYGTYYAYTVDDDGDVELAFTKNGSSNNYFYGVYAYSNYVTKSISAAGYATYCSPYALDFSDVDDLTAYIITGYESDPVLALTPVTSVPANTGVLLQGDAGSYSIPVVASSSTNVSANKLVGVTEATEMPAESIYVLLNETEGEARGVGFYLNNNAFTVGANTAYLPANFANNAKIRFFGFGDNASGIKNVVTDTNENGAIYNLSGQRVNAAYKGIIIKNGKKYLNK